MKNEEGLPIEYQPLAEHRLAELSEGCLRLWANVNKGLKLIVVALILCPATEYTGKPVSNSPDMDGLLRYKTHLGREWISFEYVKNNTFSHLFCRFNQSQIHLLYHPCLFLVWHKSKIRRPTACFQKLQRKPLPVALAAS